jgi:Ca2+-binding EF-hand superfamily protein
MFFGLFESKEAKFWRDETKRTLDDASYRFDDENKKKISKNVLTRILSVLNEIKDLNSKNKKDILFSHIDEVAKKRRNNINELKYNNTNWVEDAMVESYLNMYCGFFGKKLAREAVMVIYWCRTHLSENEINKIIQKFDLSKDLVFGDFL